MKLGRKLMHTPEIAAFFARDEHPADEPRDDDEWLDFLGQRGSARHHLIGTARLGPASDRTAAMDDTLSLHGLQGLRVVDASIMPNMPSANTYCSTAAMAETASDMIRGRPPPAPVAGVAA